MFSLHNAFRKAVFAFILVFASVLFFLPTMKAAATEGENGSDKSLPDFIALWDWSDFAATRAAFTEIIPLAVESGDKAYLAELLSQIARTHGLESNFDEAHAVLDQVWGMIKEANAGTMEKPHMRYLLERGRSFNSAGEKDKAKELFLEAYGLGLTTDFDGLTIDAAHMLGIVFTGEESVDWNLKALALAETTEDEEAAAWQGSLYNNLGWTFMDSEDYEKAREMFQNGVDYREANQHSENSRMVAHWTVARALRALDKPEEALAKLKEVSENFEGAKEDGFWHEEMGEVLLLLGEEEAGLEHLRIALPMLLEMGWVEEHEPGRIARLKELVEGD